jgi:NADH-quinone oxidoreductase subunit J
METFVFLVAGAICICGALGVVLSRNPVHSALALVATLFGVAVLFVAQEADFLAAVQVIVYAGAIVVLFLFVIMLLGVDRTEDLSVEPIVGQRTAALLLGVAVFALPVLALAATEWAATGATSNLGSLDDRPDVEAIGEVLFTRYLLAFEITSVLLAIAIVGAVSLARRSPLGEEIDVTVHEPERREAEAATVSGDIDTGADEEGTATS